MSDADQVQWTWLIRPKSAGEHAIRLVTAGQDGLRIDLQKILPPADWADESPDQVIATIQVFTELGLTARQEATFKALGAVLGVIGVVLGYPIWAMTRGRLRETPSEIDRNILPDAWPATKTRKALEQKLAMLSMTQWTLIQAVERMDGQGLHHVAEACDVGPSDSFHRLRSLELDGLVVIHKGNVHLSPEVKQALGRRRLTDLLA